MDITEDNFRNYVSKIQHLLTDDVGEKMQTGLVGFAKSNILLKDDDEHGDVDDVPGCDESEQYCCPESHYPAHGPGGLGCCAHSTFGCCPDNITPAPAPFFDVSPSTLASFIIVSEFRVVIVMVTSMAVVRMD